MNTPSGTKCEHLEALVQSTRQGKDPRKPPTVFGHWIRTCYLDDTLTYMAAYQCF